MNLDLSLLGWTHTLACLCALAAGAVVLVGPKGTSRHRSIGRLYLMAMLATNVTVVLWTPTMRARKLCVSGTTSVSERSCNSSSHRHMRACAECAALHAADCCACANREASTSDICLLSREL